MLLSLVLLQALPLYFLIHNSLLSGLLCGESACFLLNEHKVVQIQNCSMRILRKHNKIQFLALSSFFSIPPCLSTNPLCLESVRNLFLLQKINQHVTLLHFLPLPVVNIAHFAMYSKRSGKSKQLYLAISKTNIPVLQTNVLLLILVLPNMLKVL